MKYELTKNKNDNNTKLFPKDVGFVCNIRETKSRNGKVSYTFNFGGCDNQSSTLEHVTKCDLCVTYTINDTDTLEKYFEKVK